MSSDLAKDIRPIISNSDYKRKGDLIALYIILIINRDYANNLTHMSYENITAWTGWQSEKISRLINELYTLGLIDYYSGNSSGMSNLYAFPMETFGKDKHKSILPKQLRKKNTNNGESKDNLQTEHGASKIDKPSENDKELLSIEQMMETIKINDKGEENND